jgi:hypothetical protein
MTDTPHEEAEASPVVHSPMAESLTPASVGCPCCSAQQLDVVPQIVRLLHYYPSTLVVVFEI